MFWDCIPLLVTEREELLRAQNMDEPFEKKDVPMIRPQNFPSQIKDKVEVRNTSGRYLRLSRDVIDYLYGYMVPSTGYLKNFGEILSIRCHPAISSCEDPTKSPSLSR